jgi:hypothetical protein
MNRIEEISKRYHELRMQGFRSMRLYKKIQEEFGADLKPSSIRAYATGRRFPRSEGGSPSQLTYVQIPNRLLEKAEKEARRSGLSLNELINSLLTNYILDRSLDSGIKERPPNEPDKEFPPEP